MKVGICSLRSGGEKKVQPWHITEGLGGINGLSL